MNWMQQAQLVAEQISQFPAEFGLRAFPGDRFRISPAASYVNDDGVMLYTERLNSEGIWQSFAKGTAAELRREVTE